MRIISFAKRWEKLEQEFFTTFRYPRKDKDWNVGEKVQVFIKNRSPHRVFLGIAEIVSRIPRKLKVGESRSADHVTPKEAVDDGFENLKDMESFMIDYYGKDYSPAFNKLTMKWLSR